MPDEKLIVNPEDFGAPRLLKVPEVEAILRVSRRTVMYMLRDGELERVKVRGALRVTTRSVERLIEGGHE